MARIAIMYFQHNSRIMLLCLLTSTFLFLAPFLANGFVPDDEFVQSTQLTLEHELVKGKFVKRGSLAIQPIGIGSAHYNDESNLTDEELRALLKLADNSDIYRVRILSKVGHKADYVYGFVYACDLVRSGLRDNLTLAVNANAALVGLHLTVGDAADARYEACRLTAAQRELAALPRLFGTRASLLKPEAGPAPETQLYVTRMEEEKKRKQEAEHGDNRSFLAKYWMYIIPAIFIFMVASNSDTNAQGGGN